LAAWQGPSAPSPRRNLTRRQKDPGPFRDSVCRFPRMHWAPNGCRRTQSSGRPTATRGQLSAFRQCVTRRKRTSKKTKQTRISGHRAGKRGGTPPRRRRGARTWSEEGDGDWEPPETAETRQVGPAAENQSLDRRRWQKPPEGRRAPPNCQRPTGVWPLEVRTLEEGKCDPPIAGQGGSGGRRRGGRSGKGRRERLPGTGCAKGGCAVRRKNTG